MGYDGLEPLAPIQIDSHLKAADGEEEMSHAIADIARDRSSSH